ncbi:PREDICTED: NFAT activation molecule 1 [Miniopterus natalensis]|uniref:NFAT activation molecule 1 n=1 Tax=Miniopterus natalensis TaxID=291302 RepID=UPI0007A6E63B|nr:PREDICTED: NFAT activation molecule 1 [Miniopterus natalensis]
MERRPRRRRALLGPLPAPWLLGLLLAPWPLQLTGGQSVTHTGPPILASLAHKSVSFNCSITYPYTPQFKTFTVSYFYVNRQGQESLEEQTGCQPSMGQENQTLTTKCLVTPKLPSASATGTYYCSVTWPGFRMKGSGTFILVRDTGYQEPPRVPQKTLFFSFISILGALSILGTVLLLWKKKQMQALWKHPARKSPAQSAASPQQSPAEPLYTALQRRETEVYACMEREDNSPPSRRTFLSQENPHIFQSDSEFNLVYENL